ncbi:MAG: hypothetical protein M1814_000890 [Vezdaea aestivalis]|nr:MAG: hypothetical protein M1814_000890 [Vezdaea aestivalis]
MPVGHPPLANAGQAVFASVFPTSTTSSTQPTPNATPMLGFTAPGQSFGGFTSTRAPHVGSTKDPHHDVVTEQLQSSRHWHLATAFLRLPDRQITPDMNSLTHLELEAQKWLKSPDHRTQEAIEALVPLYGQTTSFSGSAGDAECDIFEWHKNEVRRHFSQFVKPGLLLDFADISPASALSKILSTLEVSQKIYLHPLTNHLLPIFAFACDPVAQREEWQAIQAQIGQIDCSFRRDLYAVVSFSLPQDHLMNILKRFFIPEAATALGIVSSKDESNGNDQDSSDDEDEMDADPPTETEKAKRARTKLVNVFHKMEEVGLGGALTQQAVAEVMDAMLSDYVQQVHAEKWEPPSRVPQDIEWWVENRFARLVIEILHELVGREGDQISGEVDATRAQISFDDFVKWKNIGIERLGRLRVTELFDVIVEWEGSKGAIEDLKGYVTTPATRNHLTSSFSAALTKRLLHPGASTSEILQLYISLIRSFAILDPQGVLLDRVARPIRRYLHDREDTAKVIVSGLLADVEDEGEEVDGEAKMTDANTEGLAFLASELNRTVEFVRPGLGDDSDLDYDDLTWIPDPIDAEPEFKKSKNSDIIGSLISLFDSKDVFVKEFQTIMGERLLKRESDFEKEDRILELLKMRFDESLLQSCMVMLRDVKDSAKVDAAIRSNPDLSKSIEGDASDNPQPTLLRTKFLSRLFWPSLHDDRFKIPSDIQKLQKRYESGFEALKQSRKLTWLNALGQVRVELDLEDRVVQLEVATWQASVIYAFQEAGAESSNVPVVRSVNDLVRRLSMDESLVRRALTFWVGERVLQETEKDVYSVLESLDESNMDKETAQAAILAAAESEASVGLTAVKSADEVAVEKMHIYWQFIVGMLTNRGPMPLQGIVTMLQFAVPGGFPYSSEELREFLGLMTKEDKLEVAAGKYKIK